MGPRHTLVHQAADWASRKPDAPAIWARDDSGGWQSQSWSEYWQAIRAFAKGIMVLGHQPGDAVTICGNNRPEWVIAQLGTMAAGGAPAPVYQTSTPQQITHIINNCGATIAVCESDELLQKFAALNAEGAVQLKHLVLMEPLKDGADKVHSFEAILDLGREQGDDEALDARMDGLQPDGIGLFIYTSGTTGVPKGAELNHRGLAMMGESVEHDYPNLAQHDIRAVSYLPLSHIAEQIFTNFLHLRMGSQVYFCDDISKVKDALLDVRPSIFVGVPRVWEKFEAALRAKLSKATGVKAKLASWAQRTELAAFEQSVKTGQPVDSFSRRMANKLVISKVHEALGFDNVLMSASGAAPIARSTLDFFASLGIVIHEGYGMTETTGLISATPYMQPRFGSVGTPLKGVEVKIADDGEIIARGENMTRGYFKMPEQTAELLDAEGWLHTGDLGRLDDESYLWITGRKKDILITAGGKNVAPAEMEQLLTALPGVAQAVVVGDAQPYLCALLALDPENLEPLRAITSQPQASLEELAADPALHTHLQGLVDSECNAKVARYQTIKKIKVLPAPFTIESGELTPSMKVKRKAVTAKYSDFVSALYSAQ